MQYTSTRNNTLSISSAQAILQGLSREGGLFVPTSIPALTMENIKALAAMDYPDRAKWVLSRFLTDFEEAELARAVDEAYATGRFDGDGPAPLTRLDSQAMLLELWHGPTCAFKDMALQLTPKLLTLAAAKCGCRKEVAILVATSGDTGKAALEGFRDIPGARIQVFYPTEGVSRMQKLQMTTQEGENVSVVGVKGNFDDCQNGVKTIFEGKAIAQRAEELGFVFSSANSINWGRLVPQIVYYVSAYCDMLRMGEITLGEPVNFCVPTGNFGNILAAYYAKEMGLPVGKLLCASNRNNVLTDFIRTGKYDRNRPFFATSSPSMDILISSNLERLLYRISGGDCALVADLMASLKTSGAYELPKAMWRSLAELFYGACCDEKQTEETIRGVLEDDHILIDPHTAVAVYAARQYQKETADKNKMVIVSTASPYKFASSVLGALDCPEFSEDDFQQLELLHKISGAAIPGSLRALEGAPVRFSAVCTPADMALETMKFLNEK